MTEHSPSTDPAAQERQMQLEQFVALLRFPARWSLSPGAFSAERAEAIWSAVSQELGLEIPNPLLRADGSSSTRTGSTRFRGTSGTALSSSVCRRLRRTRSVAIWTAVRSQRGMASGRTSGSLRRWNAEDDTTGTVEVTLVEYGVPRMTVGEGMTIQRKVGTPADCEFGWMGYHYNDKGVCLFCGRTM